MITIDMLDNFTKHYLIAALWSSSDESDESGGNPIDDNYSLDDVSQKCLQQAIDECKEFQDHNRTLLQQAYELYKFHPDATTPECSAGHDFWLTRNGHGTGYWDRTELDAEGLGDKLSDAAKSTMKFICILGMTVWFILTNITI